MAKQYVVTPSQMKKAEAMCEQKGTSCAVLMRNVGSAIALHISRIVKPCRAAVLVGSGNNGGDGFAVAHNLRKRGFSPLIVLVASAPKTDLAIDCFNEYKPDYEAVLSYPDQPETVLSELGSCGIIIDCVYGTGFHGELAPPVRRLFSYCNGSAALRFCADIASGCNATDGNADEYSFRADMTFALGAVKRVSFTSPAVSFRAILYCST